MAASGTVDVIREGGPVEDETTSAVERVAGKLVVPGAALEIVKFLALEGVVSPA